MEKLLVPVEELRPRMANAAERAGVPPEHAAILADSLLFAECRGVLSHGLVRLSQYIDRIRAGVLDPCAEMRFVTECGAIAVLDAANGLGQVAGRIANEKAMALARQYGIGLVAVRRSNHFGTGAWYTIEAAKRGFIAWNFSNASPAMAPYGGKEPLFGTDPIGVSVPRGEGMPPITLDMALSAAARGKLRLALSNGERIPSGWAVDADGQPTTDPAAALLGTLLPIGGAKGSGLALIVELLCGALTGGTLTGEVANILDTSREAGTGHVFGCIDVTHFLPLSEFAERVEETVRRVLSTSPAENGGRVLLPGEPEEAKMRAAQENGVAVTEELLASL